MSDITLSDEDVQAYGADDPSATNAADPAAATGSLVGTVIDPKDVTPPAADAGEQTQTDETTPPDSTAPDSEATPTAQDDTDYRLKAAQLEGELKAMREMYQSSQKTGTAPETPAAGDPMADIAPVLKLAETPRAEALAKFEGLLQAGKYLDAQEYLTEWKSAQLNAPALRRLVETQAVLAQSAKNQSQSDAQRQLAELDKATKGEYKRYEKEMAQLVTADAASQRLGNPPIFKSLMDVFNTCKARASGGTAPAQSASAAGKTALAKGPASGVGGAGTAPGKPVKAPSPEEKVLQEFMDYSPRSF